VIINFFFCGHNVALPAASNDKIGQLVECQPLGEFLPCPNLFNEKTIKKGEMQR